MNGYDHPDRLKVSASPVTGESPSESDKFYDKFIKFNESSGLSLVFNFRETNMDLYQFYKEVTLRGGFHQVTSDEKWEEVALALSSRSRISLSMTQIQKIYAYLLYQFEKTYYDPTPPKPNQYHQNGTTELSTTGKRKYCDSLSTNNALDTGATEKTNLPFQKPQKLKEVGKDRHSPVGVRSAYQLFLKTECDRLRKLHGESSGCLLRDMAIKAWGNLSQKYRQTYVEASKNDKKRYKKEMAEYNEQKRKQISMIKNLSGDKKSIDIDFSMLSEEEGVYHVTLPAYAKNVEVSEQSTLDLTREDGGNEAVFEASWDGYCELNLDISS